MGVLTFKFELMLLIWSVWAGLMTMPVTCVVPLVTAVVVLSMVAYCCPFTMCTWWMGPAEAGKVDVSLVVSIRGRWIRGAATMEEELERWAHWWAWGVLVEPVQWWNRVGWESRQRLAKPIDRSIDHESHSGSMPLTCCFVLRGNLSHK